MLHRLALNPWNVGVGSALGLALFLLGTQIASWFPQEPPIWAEHVTTTFVPGTRRWRVAEEIVSEDNCGFVLFERRFRDEVLDRWVMLRPTDSSPQTTDGGIARADIRKGRHPAWAEYDVTGSGLQRGIYTVNVSLAECEETHYNGTYSLIPVVKYNFTGTPW